LKSVKTIKLTPDPQLARLRGVIPSGMVLNRGGDRLYVCESGLNAVAVIDTNTFAVLGHIPTGWFPMQITLSPDEQTLYVATQKGLGRGPRGAKNRRPDNDERYSLPDMPGMINAVPIPTNVQLVAWTQEVLVNNGIIDKRTQRAALPNTALPLIPGKASEQIKYVVFITKENHTFDGIFGGLKGAKGEPEYAEFGMQGWIREKGKAERVPIMPNHIRLAEQFAISDNFYMEPQASGDGHRWLVGVYPSLWTTRVFYSGWNYMRSNDAPGRLVSFGSDGSQIPEDYLENGSLWEHLNRGGITFRNYGEGYELPQTDEGPKTSKTGTFYQANYPMPKVLFDNTCFEFPAYNNYIPDIARADWFKEDLEKYRKTHNGKIPQFLNIAICNDHGAGARPKDGYPYVCSFMADNDLALGQIVDYLSHLPEWKNMAIFVTQDDSGGDDDHIDRHRSFVLTISPYAKRGYVSRDHTSIMSIIKSIYLLFGLGPNNLFDALATDLSDMFTDKPDFTPYTLVPADPRVFKPEETFDPSDPKFERRRQMKPDVAMDDPKFVEWLRTRK
jgi:YVTN family beta-propeller protein